MVAIISLTCVWLAALVSAHADLQETIVKNCLDAFRAGAAEYSMVVEAKEVAIFPICAPAMSAIYSTRAMHYEPKAYLALVRGTMTCTDEVESEPVGAAADARPMQQLDGLLAQFRCGLDGSVGHGKFFSRPAGSFGRIGLSPEQAAQTAGLEGRASVADAVLVETRPFHFFWALPCGGEKYFVDAHTGDRMTDGQMVQRTMPGLPLSLPPPWTPTGRVYYMYENNVQIPIELAPDELGVVLPRDADVQACRQALLSCEGVASADIVVPPPSHTGMQDSVNAITLRFDKVRSIGELEGIARDLMSRPEVDIASPVFRQQDVDGYVFDFIFTYRMHLTIYPAGVAGIADILREHAELTVLASTQTAFHNPVRYALRADPNRISTADLIDLMNRIHDAGNTKFVGLAKLVLHHPNWDAQYEGVPQ